MWEFISGNGIKPSQKRKTDEDKNSYCYKYLKSLYYLIKWVFKMNYSFMSKCFDFLFHQLKNKTGPLKI
jgi:hypothetical protein